MSTIRSKAKVFLSKSGLKLHGRFAVSRIYRAKQDTARKVDLWWFDLPIRNIVKEPNGFYSMLCEIDNDEFRVYTVPNKFLMERLSAFDTRYNECIRLHIDENGIDQRGPGRVSFERFLVIKK